MTRNEYERARQNLITKRRSLTAQVRSNGHKPTYRAAVKAQLDRLPPKLPKLPIIPAYQLSDSGGVFAGTTYSKDEAESYLADGYTYKTVPAYGVGGNDPAPADLVALVE